MATHTLATSGNLVAVTFSGAVTVLLPADLATINQDILDDVNVTHPPAHYSGCGGFVREGLLYVPNRGTLKVLPGDVVAVDTASGVGWPILVSAGAIANGTWTYT